MKLPTIQGITASAAPELPGYRRDTPPSLDRGIRASEGDRGGSPELVHSRAVFFSRFDESRPSQKDKIYLPSKSDPARNLTWPSKSIPARNLTWLCLPKPEPDMGSELGEKPHVPTSRSDHP